MRPTRTCIARQRSTWRKAFHFNSSHYKPIVSVNLGPQWPDASRIILALNVKAERTDYLVSLETGYRFGITYLDYYHRGAGTPRTLSRPIECIWCINEKDTKKIVKKETRRLTRKEWSKKIKRKFLSSRLSKLGFPYTFTGRFTRWWLAAGAARTFRRATSRSWPSRQWTWNFSRW